MKRKSKCDSDILMINKNISILHVAMCRRINNKSFVCIVIQTWKRIFSSLILSCFNPVKQQYLQHQKCKKCVTIPLCCYCNTVKIPSYISAVFIILYYVKYCWDILRDESSCRLFYKYVIYNLEIYISASNQWLPINPLYLNSSETMLTAKIMVWAVFWGMSLVGSIKCML